MKSVSVSLTHLHLFICSTPFTGDLLKLYHYPRVFFPVEYKDIHQNVHSMAIYGDHLMSSSFGLIVIFFKKGPSLCTICSKWRM